MSQQIEPSVSPGRRSSPKMLAMHRDGAAMKVLLIDDHVLIREALRSVFADVRPQSEVLDATGAVQALEIAQAHMDIGLVVLDLSLPDGDGLDVLKSLRSLVPAAGVVVLSASREPSVVANALRLGAQGFIPKSASYSVMMAALQLVLARGHLCPARDTERGEGRRARGHGSDRQRHGL